MVQLGSFADERNALALRDRLRDKGHRAFVATAGGSGAKVTRVFVGPQLERERSQAAVEPLRRETGLEGMVVRFPR